VRSKVWQYAYYGSSSRLASLRDPKLHFRYRNTYDPASGRIVSQLDALGNETQYEWDPDDRQAKIIGPHGGEWQFFYDERNVLVSQDDPLENTTLFEFDADVNLTRFEDANDNVTVMSYDARGNMLTRVDAEEEQETWTYTARNDVATYTDKRGNTTDFGYDTAGNLTSVTAPDPDGGGPLTRPVTSYARDAAFWFFSEF
jgi:YD repeat-containing protein